MGTQIIITYSKNIASIVLIMSTLFISLSCKDDVNNVNDEKTPTVAHRISNSPYPVSQTPDKLFVINDANFSASQRITIGTLQGILAQTEPQIYRVATEGYLMWVNDLKDNYSVELDYSLDSNFEGLIAEFKDQINGYTLSSAEASSIHVAISLAGITKSIVVLPEDEEVMNSLGIQILADARDKDMNWLLDNYNDFNVNTVCYQKADKATHLGDYAVFGKSLFFFDDINSELTTRIFSLMQPNSALLGWGDDEFKLVEKASKNSIFVNPGDWALNLSTLSNFEIETKQVKHNNTPEVVEDVHTVCFLVSDGDNIIWLLNDYATNPKWFGSTNRNKVKIGWTMSPAMSELAPTVLNYFYAQADQSDVGKDYFIASSSGQGYIYPDLYGSLDSYTTQLNEYMAKSDLNILNIIGNSMDDEYLIPYLNQSNIDALFYYYFSDYAGGKGEIKWVSGKPVITGRYKLWDGFETPSSIATKLNNLSTDINSADGYSLIPVHIWSNGVDEIVECAELLDENVRVVTPDEFVSLIEQNVQH